MEKSFDLRVEYAKQDILNVLNNSQLPLSVLNMIVKETQATVSQQYDNYIRHEVNEYERHLQETPTEPEVVSEDN